MEKWQRREIATTDEMWEAAQQAALTARISRREWIRLAIAEKLENLEK